MILKIIKWSLNKKNSKNRKIVAVQGRFYPMKTAQMNVICMTVMLVKCQKLAWMSELVHFALSHTEFGVICSLNQTKKTAKAR